MLRAQAKGIMNVRHRRRVYSSQLGICNRQRLSIFRPHTIGMQDVGWVERGHRRCRASPTHWDRIGAAATKIHRSFGGVFR
jgi:hypothetical protein